MARDFRREIGDAMRANDTNALVAIAYQLLGRVEADDERRARQANKKRAEREARKLSGTSRMSGNVPGHPKTSGDIPEGVPPKRSIPNPPPPSAQVIAKLGDVRLQRGLDMLREKFTAEEWEDVAAFFLRRKYDRWAEWAAAMLREVGPGSQFEPGDLLSVCRDDGTLDKRLGSAGILRSFLGTARLQRIGHTRSPPAHAARSSSTSRRGTLAPAGTPAPPTDPDVGPKWQT